MIRISLLCMMLALLNLSCSKDAPVADEAIEAEDVADDAEMEVAPIEPVDQIPTPAAAEQVTEAAPAVPVASSLYYVKAETINVRKEPSDTATVLAKLEQGQRVHVKAVNGDWAELKSGGFVSMKLLSQTGVGVKRNRGDWKKKS